MDWAYYALIAMVSVGISTALFKMPSFKGYSSLHSTFWVNMFSLCMSVFVYMYFIGNKGITSVSWYGILWGLLFALTMAQQKLLLHRMETNTLLPITSSLSNVVTVLLGVALFSEHISPLQFVATAIILSSVFLYTKKKGGLILDAHALRLGVGIIVASTMSKVIQKIGAIHDSIFHFAVYQYIGATLCALFLVFIFEKSTIRHLLAIKHTWKISLVSGFFMTIAGYAFLKALALGPLSGVYPIAAGYIFVTSILGVWLYKEKFTTYKILLMMLTFIGIILIKLG